MLRLASVFAALPIPFPVPVEAQAMQEMDGVVPMPCCGSTGACQPFQRTAYVKLQEGLVQGDRIWILVDK